MEKIKMYQTEYEKPKVTLLQESGLGVAEIAARTCYDSFGFSYSIWYIFIFSIAMPILIYFDTIIAILTKGSK